MSEGFPGSTPNGSTKSFAVRSITDFLRKLEIEIRQLREAEATGLDEELVSHIGMNAAVTAYHTGDWLFGQLTATQIADFNRVLGTNVRDATEFLSEVCARSRDLQMCREIAHHSKHFEMRKPDHMIVAATSAGTCTASLTAPFASIVRRAVDDPIPERMLRASSQGPRRYKIQFVPSRATVLKIVDGKTRHRASDVYERVLQIWKEFLADPVEAAHRHLLSARF